MSRTFATGKYSNAVCDRCAQVFPYRELQREIVQYKTIQQNLAFVNLRVCAECKDTDHYVKVITADAQALSDPRVDTVEAPIAPPANQSLDSTGLVWDDVHTKTWAPPMPNQTFGS